MFSLIKNHPKAVIWAVIVHIVFLVTMGISFHFIDAPSVSHAEVKVVKAVLLDDSIAKRNLKKKLEQQRKKAELKRRKEKKRRHELKVKAELKKKKLAKLAAQEKRRREDEIIKQQQKQVEEKNRRIAQEKERKQREDELKKELDEEQQRLSAEREARNETIISKQTAIIQGHIEQRWIKPVSAKPGMVTVISVNLIPSGEVISVRYIKRSGNSAFDQSVYNAVKRASPLPLPPVEYGLADRFREITLNFGQRK